MKMKEGKLQLNTYSDSGHGWARVELVELKRLGIANEISACSYMKGKYAYLEEDCDATIYIRSYMKDMNQDSGWRTVDNFIDFICHYSERSSIRNYNNYRTNRNL